MGIIRLALMGWVLVDYHGLRGFAASAVVSV
jgi:hypothetical protein